MFTVRKYLIGLLIGTIVFSGIALVDEAIVKLSLATASSLAFSIVGSFYSAGLISTKADGGKARMIIFLVLLCFFLYVFTQIAKGIIWLFSFSIWIYITVLIVSVIMFTIYMVFKDKETRIIYESTVNKDSDETVEVSQPVINKIRSIEIKSEELKTIKQLLLEETKLDYIKAYYNNPNSPGLEYVKVYKSSLKYSVVKGYIKMDNAAAFWADVHYAVDKRWIRI